MLTGAGKRMREDLALRMVAHPGERFLRSYLPLRFDISTGFVLGAALLRLKLKHHLSIG